MVAYTYVGYAVVILLCAGLLVVACALAFSVVETKMQKRRDDAGTLAVIRLATRLRGDSYWFSEDRRTAWLLKEIADSLASHHCISDTGNLRDRWRQWNPGDGA